MKTKIPFIVGPTAVGKSALSIALAQLLGAELISGDSRQFYKEISIGTAKPSEIELAAVKHHFIDSLSVFDRYTAGMFEKDALNLIHSNLSPTQPFPYIVCGGSGLYLNALAFGLDEMPEIDPSMRLKLQADFNENGMDWLQKSVRQLDPEYALIADMSNHVRLLRALEVCVSTGKPFSSFRKQHSTLKRDFDIVWIGLALPREELYHRIDERVDIMMEHGLFDEVNAWKDHLHLEPFRTIGYQEWVYYFEGSLSKKQTIDLIKQHSRNYAKRQLTWFRKNKDIHWLDPNQDDIIQQAEKIIRH